ncbi:MAG: fumarate/nitrate reduction transcriptional regulator Fnr [Cocleimonas sp.]
MPPIVLALLTEKSYSEPMQHKPHSFNQNPVSCDSCSLINVCLPSGLSSKELEQLETAIDKTVKIKKKETVFNANDKIEGIYAVKSGSIKTSISNQDGQEQVLEFHLPGDMLGFDAFNTGTHTCHATALEDTFLCKIPIDTFDNLCEHLPGLRRELRHQVGKEIAHNQSLLLSLGQQQTDERFATFLLTMSEHYQSRGFSSKEFVIPMSRQDLSNYLGMAVETLSRIISRMTESGIIKIDRRMVVISDSEKLHRLAHSYCQNSSTNKNLA